MVVVLTYVGVLVVAVAVGASQAPSLEAVAPVVDTVAETASSTIAVAHLTCQPQQIQKVREEDWPEESVRVSLCRLSPLAS